MIGWLDVVMVIAGMACCYVGGYMMGRNGRKTGWNQECKCDGLTISNKIEVELDPERFPHMCKQPKALRAAYGLFQDKVTEQFHKALVMSEDTLQKKAEESAQ